MNTEKHWNNVARTLLLNKKIVNVRYMTTEEAENIGWDKRSVVFVLDDGSMCFISMDDEGNNGGSLFYQNQDINSGVLPTLGL